MVQFTYIGGDYMETGNQNSWFYVRNRQQEGPISLFELTKMFEQGVLDQNTLIWTKDMHGWKSAGLLDHLSPFFNNTITLETRQEILPLNCLFEWHSQIRYIARMFDLTIFSSLVGIFLTIFPSHYLSEISFAFLGLLILSLWAATEPIILFIFGNTLGKSLLNTRIRSITGEPLDYLTAFKRSVYIALSGMGLGIPFFSFLFSIHSHFRRTKNGMSPWDVKYGTIILYGETSIGRILLAALLPAALFCTGFIFGKI